MNTTPAMQIRHTQHDRWFVAAKWPDGQVEDICDFRSEVEANDWVTHDLQDWLDARNTRPARRR